MLSWAWLELIPLSAVLAPGRLLGLYQSPAICPLQLGHEKSSLGALVTIIGLRSVQIGYSWICKPHTLPPTFVHFLNHHGGKELWFYKAAKVSSLCCPFPS